MKTIDEAAIEYAEKLDPEILMSTIPQISELSFKSGVAFAEEWISVEDELPIFDKNKLVSGEYDLYLVKMRIGSISPKTTYAVSFLTREDRWNCEFDWNVVTHYRPINKK